MNTLVDRLLEFVGVQRWVTVRTVDSNYAFDSYYQIHVSVFDEAIVDGRLVRDHDEFIARAVEYDERGVQITGFNIGSPFEHDYLLKVIEARGELNEMLDELKDDEL